MGDKVDLSATDGRGFGPTAAGVTIKGKFATKDLVSPQGSIREFVGPDGVVFGVVWTGRSHPDLTELLGTFYGEYKIMHQRRAGPAGPGGIQMRGSRRTMQSSRVVVERFGHMGALRGRAFVPALVPQGVNVHEIK